MFGGYVIFEHFLHFILLSIVSEEIQENKFLEDMLVCKLDRTAHRCIRNWEHLACTQQVNAPLETRLRCKLISRGSCTRTLIEFLAVEKGDKSVQDLITALVKIRRNDVVKMIREVYPGMFHHNYIFSLSFVFEHPRSYEWSGVEPNSLNIFRCMKSFASGSNKNGKDKIFWNCSTLKIF